MWVVGMDVSMRDGDEEFAGCGVADGPTRVVVVVVIGDVGVEEEEVEVVVAEVEATSGAVI
ncbi:hypothetical protein KI387_003912, partial [Taxus chinensis]